MELHQLATDRLSWYRTEHVFSHVADIETIDDLSFAEQYAAENKLKIFVLGNGSNVFFKKRKVRSIIARPIFEKTISQDGDVFTVSGNTNISKLLITLRAQSRSGPYYLASVPATVGGAVAMNAGTGSADNKFISDFLLDVTVWKNGSVKVLEKNDLGIEFRKTIFSESYCGVIRQARFAFPKTSLDGDPIQTRKRWAREFQNATIPNCGSVFRRFNGGVMGLVRALTRFLPAYICNKSLIWISNTSKHPRWIRFLIVLTKVLHRLIGRRCELEIREVE